MPGVLERCVLDCQGARFVGCQVSVAFLALGEPLGLFKSLLGTFKCPTSYMPGVPERGVLDCQGARLCPICWLSVFCGFLGPWRSLESP